MNQNDITIEEKDNIIALFDGWELIKGNASTICPSCDEGRLPSGWCICGQKADRYVRGKIAVSSFSYNNWSDLMPIVNRIHKFKEWHADGKKLKLMSSLTIYMELDGDNNKCRCSILGNITFIQNQTIPHDYFQVDLPSIFVYKDTLIEAVHEAVYQFITWFNNQINPFQ